MHHHRWRALPPRRGLWGHIGNRSLKAVAPLDRKCCSSDIIRALKTRCRATKATKQPGLQKASYDLRTIGITVRVQPALGTPRRFKISSAKSLSVRIISTITQVQLNTLIVLAIAMSYRSNAWHPLDLFETPQYGQNQANFSHSDARGCSSNSNKRCSAPWL